MAGESNTPGIFVHLTVKDGPAAIELYRNAFGAKELFKQMADDGERVLHATLSMFGGHVMLCDEFPEHLLELFWSRFGETMQRLGYSESAAA